MNTSSYIPEKNNSKRTTIDKTLRNNTLKMKNMATQSRVREKIIFLSNKCYDNPTLEICDIFWSYINNVEVVLNKHETLIYKKIDSTDSKEDRWDVI